MGLYLNIKKTKVMKTAGNDTVHKTIDNEETVNRLQDLLFLGSKIVHSCESKPEISKRIALGHNTMQGMAKIYKSKDISIVIKILIINKIVFPISMYACESWTLKKVDRRKINVFVLWGWGRMLHKGHKQEKVKTKISLEGKTSGSGYIM